MFLPVGAKAAPATKIGSQPATVVGATATIDSPILAGLSTSVTRTITVSNPIGNPAITSITISIPKAAATTVPGNAGAYPADSGVPGSPTAATYGSGPWAVVFSAGTGNVLVPGGAAIKVTLTFTTEAATTVSKVADSYLLSVSALDQSGGTTTLPTIGIYETASTTVTITVPTGTTFTAGTLAPFSASGADAGLPLVVSAVGSVSSTGGHASKTTKENPSTLTTASTAVPFTVNDTTAETLTVTVSGGSLDPDSLGTGVITASVVVTVTAGPVSSLAVCFTGIAGYTCPVQPKMWNQTSLTAINGASITVSTSDKFGNPVVVGAATTVTVTTITLAGQAAGFSSTQNTYGTPYPYTPTGGVSPSETVTISSGFSSTTLTGYYYFFGVDYLSQSELVATTSSSGLGTGTSIILQTFAFQNTGTITPSSPVTVAAGSTEKVTVTLPSGAIQAGLPIYFLVDNTTGHYTGTFTGGVRQIEAVTSTSGTASATLTVDTNANLPRSTYVEALLASTPKANSSLGFAGIQSALITTGPGPFAALTVTAYFDTSQLHKSTNIVPSGTLYIDVASSDAYGNTFAVASGAQVMQVNLAATGGLLSATTAFIASGKFDTAGSVYNIQFVAPSTIGSSVVLSATAVYNGVSATGSDTVNIVSKTPTLSATVSPATITTGVPIVFSGWANVSTGLAVGGVPATMSLIQYSLNGAANVSAGAFTLANNQYSFSILLTAGSHNSIVIWVEDQAANWAQITIAIPPIPVGSTFTFPITPVVTTAFTVGNAIAATVTNNAPNALTVVVFAVVNNAAGQTVLISSGTISLAAGATGVAYPVLAGLAHGTYTVNLFVLSTTGISYSATSTISVTV